jgi:hypothetical protein
MGDAYWWLIQLDRYYQANICILEKMKLEWVTLFALRGNAYMWWSSWKQGNQNITWEKFERAFIKKFIPELWEMMEGNEQEATVTMMQVRSEHDDDSTTESKKVEAYSTEVGDYHSDINISKSDGDLTDSVVLNNSISTVCSPKASDRKERAVETEMQSVEETVIQELPLSPDCCQPEAALLRRVPPPKPPDFARDVVLLPSPQPPDPNSYVDGNGSLVKLTPPSESPATDSSVKVVGIASKESPVTRTNLMEKKERRVVWVFYIVGPAFDSIVALTSQREGCKRVNWIFQKWSVILNRMGQAQTNIGLLEDDFRAWTDISKFLLKHNMHINSACFIVTEGMYGMYLTHELAVSFIYSLMQEGSNCLKYTLVSTDMGIEVVLTLEALNHVDYYFENCHLFKIHLSLGSIVGKYKGIRVLYLKVENVVDVGVRCFEKYRGFSGLITNYQFEGTIIERDFVVVSFLDYAMACMTKVNTVGLEVKCTFDLHKRVHKIKSNEEAISIGRHIIVA